MFPFSNSVTPAVRTHLDSQTAYINDLTKTMANTFQNICQANLQLGQTLLEETMTAGQRMLTTERGTDALGAAAARVQPAADKLLAYQQHLSRLAADAQVELARVTERHAPTTSRSAQNLAEEVQRDAVETTSQHMRQQEDALKNFRDPFQHENGEARMGSNAQGKGGARTSTPGAGASMQSSSPDSDRPVQGAKGQPEQAAQQAGNKTSVKQT